MPDQTAADSAEPDDDPNTDAAARRTPGDLTRALEVFARTEQPIAVTLFRVFFKAVGPAGARRLLSEETIKAVVAADARRSDQSHTHRLLLIAAGLVALCILCATLLLLIYLLRDRVELIRAVLAGVGLLVSHGAAVGVGGYVARRRDHEKRRS